MCHPCLINVLFLYRKTWKAYSRPRAYALRMKMWYVVVGRNGGPISEAIEWYVNFDSL